MNTRKVVWVLMIVALWVGVTAGVACRRAQGPGAPPADQAAAPSAEPEAVSEQPAEERLPTLSESQSAAAKPAEATQPALAEARPEPLAVQPAAMEPPAAQTPSAQTQPAAEAKPAEPAVETKPAETPEAKLAEPAAEPKPAEEKPAGPAPTAAAQPLGEALVKAPLGLPPVPVGEDNPLTAEKIELGRMLYFDKRVSRDGTISCATCHDPQMAWAEHSSTSTGIDKQQGARNSPTVINAAYASSQFWDGRAKSLEEQALGPVENPIEMGHSMDAVVEGFKKIPEYRDRFQNVFGEEITKENFGKAIAAFERTVLSGNSPYDRFTTGDQNALSDAQKRGLKKFNDACAGCHTPPLFSNYAFHNAGVGMDKENPDPGRQKITGHDRDLGKFRVPALREVANTAPYFHDGSAATLEEAVALMATGGKDNPNLSGALKAVRDEELTAEDQKDLVEFLKALSGEYPVVEPPQMPAGE